MPESGRELPARSRGRLSASQVAGHPLLGARGPILRPLAGGRAAVRGWGAELGLSISPAAGSGSLWRWGEPYTFMGGGTARG